MDNKTRVHELISRFMEGLASDGELAELHQLIVEDTVAADAFAEATRFEATLLEIFSNDRTAREARQLLEDTNVIVAQAIEEMRSSETLRIPSSRLTMFQRFKTTSAASVAMVLVTGLCVFGLFNRAGERGLLLVDDLPGPISNAIVLPDGAQEDGVPVAVITQMIGAKFSRNGYVPVVGDQFNTGVYRLTSGILELTFAHSPEIILEAPCEFDLKGRELMLLHRGKISAKVPKGAGDFTVETPSATVIDQGTEFAVQVDDKDDSEVHVFDGMVSVTPRTGDSLFPAILRGQTASAIGKKSSTPCGINLDGDRFLRSLNEPDSKYAHLVLQWDPVLYFRMIPSGGIIHDAGPLGVNAVIVRGDSEGTPWTVGRIGTALQFGGPSSKDYAVVPEYPKANNGTITVAAWVFAKSRPRSATIAKNWASEEHGQFHFGLRHDMGELEILVSDAAGQVIAVREEKAPLPIGRWQHVAFVADGSTLRLFRNGDEVGSTPCSGLGGDPRLKVMGIGVQLNREGSQPDIMRHNDDDPAISDYWHGRIDELALFNHALSPEQIRELYESAE